MPEPRQHKLVMGNRFTEIVPCLPAYLARKAEETFSVEDEENDDIWYGFDRESSTIYTGLVPFFKRFAKKNKIKIRFVDRRKKPSGEPFESNWTMRDYQEPAVQRLCEATRGSLSAGTGSGKTIVALETFARVGVRGVIIVPTQIIWGQFLKTAVKMFLSDGEELPEDFDDYSTKKAWQWAKGKTKCDIGVIGQGEWEPGFLTVAISAALDGGSRSRKFLKSVEFLYADEGHHLAANTWFNAAMRSNAYYRFGGSGTMLRTDGQDMKLFATTGPVVYTITTSELIRKGWLAKPIIKMVQCESDGLGTPTDWANYYRVNVVYGTQRTDIILALLRQSIKRNIKTLCLFGWDEHATNILARIYSEERCYIDYVKSGFGKAQIQEAIERFASGEVRVLMATTLLSEGYDLCSIDRLIRASGMKSFINITQETGRVLRVEDAPQVGVRTEVFDFYDLDGGPLEEHSEERLKAWQSEEEFDVAVIDSWRQMSFEDQMTASYEAYGGPMPEDPPEMSDRVFYICEDDV